MPFKSIEADVAIVGAGIAGVSAALSCAEMGLKTVLLEKGAHFSARGLHIGVVYSRLMKKLGVESRKADIARQWIATTGGRAKEAHIWRFLNESEAAMNWLLDKTEKRGVACKLYGGWYKGDTYPEYPGTHMFDCQVSGAVKIMLEDALKLGAQAFWNTPAKKLIRDSAGKVTAVTAASPDGEVRVNVNKAVILATGGIEGSRELCEKYAPLALKAGANLYTPRGATTGDGHMMAQRVGAALQDAPFPCILHPQNYSLIHYFYLFVDDGGKRFMNEDTWAQGKSVQILSRGSDHAYAIFDSKWEAEVAESLAIGGGMFWDSAMRGLGEPWNADNNRSRIEAYCREGKVGWRADSLEELADKTGLPRESFMATVERYNALARSGRDADFGKRSELLTTISKPPYYALKFGPALLAVPGGLHTDIDLRVLDGCEKPIENLYAAGNIAGDVYTIDYPLALPGNSHGHALTCGYMLGRFLGKQL